MQSRYDLRVAQREPNRETIAAIGEIEAGAGECSADSTSDVFDRVTMGRRGQP
jgi:hypothetical protein